MDVIQGNIYDYPQYYDLVFGSDWKAEYDFLLSCFDKHVDGEVRRVFEPACGTGRLLYRLADKGFQASGLDLNSSAVDYCNDRLERKGFPRSVFVGDMCDFRLDQPVDAAFNMINSFRHLGSEQMARDHLACISEALRPGGVYILGLHLTPSVGEPSDEESWSARRGNLCVNTHMATIDRDVGRRVERFSMSYYVYTPTRSFQLADEIEFRTYTARQFRQLVARSKNLEIAEIYDFAYQIDEPVELWPETEDAVFVIRRT